MILAVSHLGAKSLLGEIFHHLCYCTFVAFVDPICTRVIDGYIHHLM